MPWHKKQTNKQTKTKQNKKKLFDLKSAITSMHVFAECCMYIKTDTYIVKKLGRIYKKDLLKFKLKLKN